MELREGMRVRLCSLEDADPDNVVIAPPMERHFGGVVTVARTVALSCGRAFRIEEDGRCWWYDSRWIVEETQTQTPAGYHVCQECGAAYEAKIDTPERLAAFRGRHVCPACAVDRVAEAGEYHSRRFGIIDRGEKRGRVPYFGAEIECDGFDYESEAESTAGEALSCLYCGTDAPWAYLEHDGSLDDGVELITQPHAANDPSIYVKIDKYLRAMEEGGAYLGHSNTGLHIHLDRKYYGALSDSIGLVASYLACVLWDRGLSLLARRDDIYNGDTCPNKDANISRHKNSRYRAVNLCNSATVEFRIFGGARSGIDVQAAVIISKGLMKLAKRYLRAGYGLKPGDYLHEGITDRADDVTLQSLLRVLSDGDRQTLQAYVETLGHTSRALLKEVF